MPRGMNSQLRKSAKDTLYESLVVIERWRVHYNTISPHSALVDFNLMQLHDDVFWFESFYHF